MVSAPGARERQVGVSGSFCFQLLGERHFGFPLPSTCWGSCLEPLFGPGKGWRVAVTLSLLLQFHGVVPSPVHVPQQDGQCLSDLCPKSRVRGTAWPRGCMLTQTKRAQKGSVMAGAVQPARSGREEAGGRWRQEQAGMCRGKSLLPSCQCNALGWEQSRARL